ncbi:MAG: TIGR01777 family protein [Chloroflexi bacterium]|nr:TIGR01777 family protein [Chloroflexota bacterium]
MKVIVVGGSGFIGSHLVAALLGRRHSVIVFDRHPPRQSVDFVRVDLTGQVLSPELFSGADAIIHLAGRNVFARWNEKVKKEIYDSRILSTRSLVSSIERLERKPGVLVSASAVGYYGDRGEEELDESSAPGNDFLAGVCIDWEAEARKAEASGLRTVQVRTAPVMGHGGILGKMVPLYRWGLGGPMGNGRQWFPWIHIQDIVGIYVLAVESEAMSGPVNACAPGRVRNKEFSDALAKVLKRPAFMTIPQWATRIALNGLADVVLSSQKAIPKKIVGLGYRFLFPDIAGALIDLLARPQKKQGN